MGYQEDLYRFGHFDSLNMDAEADPDNEFFENYVLPELLDYTKEKIHETTYNEDEIRGLVGISGGIDSVTAAELSREVMENSEEPSHLSLVGFVGTNSEDERYIRRYLNQFESDEIEVEKRLLDISDRLDSIDQDLREISPEHDYPGELPTRLISTYLLEYADRNNCCNIGTTNATEIMLGEFSSGSGSDYNPFADFFKTSIFELADMLEVPEFIIERSPRNSSFGQSKVDSYLEGVPSDVSDREVFAVLDAAIWGLMDDRSPEEVSNQLGHDLDLIQNLNDRIEEQEPRRESTYFPLVSVEAEKDAALPIEDEDLKQTITNYMYEGVKNV